MFDANLKYEGFCVWLINLLMMVHVPWYSQWQYRLSVQDVSGYLDLNS
jgi:hypothetical protein